ncbi:MAG: crossover junction endodeoxyribonuclease RuvC [Simkaniaceae bacterium]
MKRKILGIDPGTVVTGYGIIEVDQNQLAPLDFGAIRPPPRLPLHERYQIIFDELEKLIQAFEPHDLSVETQFVYKNPSSALKLSMARGVAILAATRAKISVYEYTPKKAKLAVVGTGSASKHQVQQMIQHLLKLKKPPTPEDAADALALAICHANTLKQNVRLSKRNTSSP